MPHLAQPRESEPRGPELGGLSSVRGAVCALVTGPGLPASDMLMQFVGNLNQIPEPSRFLFAEHGILCATMLAEELDRSFQKTKPHTSVVVGVTECSSPPARGDHGPGQKVVTPSSKLGGAQMTPPAFSLDGYAGEDKARTQSRAPRCSECSPAA